MRNIKLTGVTNYEAAVVSWMKENGLDEIIFVASNSKKYFGKYGTLVEYWYDSTIHWYEKPRKVARLIADYFNQNEAIVNTHVYEDDDGYDCSYNVLYFFDKPYKVLKEEIYDNDGNTNSNKLIMLANGQLYDITDHYWFSMSSSKELKQAIKNGYDYKNSDIWDYDSYESEDDKIQRLENEATEKIIRSSVDKLLANSDFKEEAKAVANWINDNQEMLDKDKVSDKEAFKKYVYGFTPQYVLFSIKADLFYKWISSSTKPAYAKILIKNKVEYDYAGRILESPKVCLEVLRKNFPKLDKIIEERLSDPFCSVTLEDLEKEAMVTSNFSWTRAMADIASKLGFSPSWEPWYKIFI